MTSIEVPDTMAAMLRTLAARAGVSVGDYVTELAVTVSVHQHAAVLDEQFYSDAEMDRLAS